MVEGLSKGGHVWDAGQVWEKGGHVGKDCIGRGVVVGDRQR